jgi:hypothetical protein
MVYFVFNGTMTFGIGNQGPGLGHAQKKDSDGQ